MTNAKESQNFKTKPCLSTDCRWNDHASCSGEESALWPDSTITMRSCTCECHNKA